MSEIEQDALLDTLESENRRSLRVKGVLVAALCVTVCAAAGAVLLRIWP